MEKSKSRKRPQEKPPIFAPPSEDEVLEEYRFYLHEQLNGDDNDRLTLTSGYQAFEVSMYQSALDDYKETLQEYEAKSKRQRNRACIRKLKQ